MRTIARYLLTMTGCFVMCGIGAFAQVQSANDPFAPYTGCKLQDGPSVVETAPLAPGVSKRTVPLINGSYAVKMLAGRRVMFAYPGEDFYANVKVEILPPDGYADSKAALIGNFEYLHASGGDNSRNDKLKPQLNGFEIMGLDGAKFESNVLGIYLFFDDSTRTVTTIYFLNYSPPKRIHFKTMEEYAVLRDQFLNNYTSCIRESLRTASVTK